MKTIHYQVIRVVLGIALAVLASMESSMWWVVAIPWAAVCIVGIIATIPIVFLIGIGAGAAQADWMSDGFIIALVIVTPTTLAVIASALMSLWKTRQDSANEPNQAEQGGTGQPATSPESDFQGIDKPQPESEGRSR